MRIGWTDGAFDIYKPKHDQFLRQAAKVCDFLIVGVWSDKRVREIKGIARPYQTFRTRMMPVWQHAGAVVMDDRTHDWLNHLRPDVYIVGDWWMHAYARSIKPPFGVDVVMISCNGSSDMTGAHVGTSQPEPPWGQVWGPAASAYNRKRMLSEPPIAEQLDAWRTQAHETPQHDPLSRVRAGSLAVDPEHDGRLRFGCDDNAQQERGHGPEAEPAPGSKTRV